MLVSQPSSDAVSNTIPIADGKPLEWRHLIAPAEPFLASVSQTLAEQIREFDQDIAAYAEYALTNQGKQIRPALVALSGGAIGKVADQHVMVAVIIEMVHLATLVHDDVMDGANVRRGRPTLAANWGTEISVLLGDCLFAHALKLAAGFPTTEICRAVAAATNTVCSGEILQTQRRRCFDLSLAEYFKVLSMKTGELFALSCDLGAYLAGATPAQRAALRQYGMATGTAYQIYDDCLDLFGSEAAVGKSLGTDLAKGKLTLPLLLALQRGSNQDRRQLESLISHWSPEQLPVVLAILQRHQTLEESQTAVHQRLENARGCLTDLPESNSTAGLAGIADYLEQQTAALGGLAPRI
jgi:octaprenyl-diphosphate synthase